jgi:endonuclease/exonuclease/phosphatase (EEP) superfamily protein YafD
MLELIQRLIQITCIITFLLTVASFFGRYLYFELTTHFRPQYLLVSIFCAILLCILKDWKWIVPCVICAVFNGIYISPYYFSEKNQAQDVPTTNLRLVLVNIEAGNKDLENLTQSLDSANPDILVLQEVTEGWWRKIQSLTETYPYSKPLPRSGGGGLALFSRFPIDQTDVLQLDSSPHPAIFAKINLDGTTLSLLTIHPPTPMRRDKFANRNKQFAESASIMKSAPNPKVLIGDFNTTMWSPYFTDLVEDSGLRDVRKGRGIYPSWHSILPRSMRIPIDHCLVGEGIEVSDLGLGDFTGSDHFPLIVDLKVEK